MKPYTIHIAPMKDLAIGYRMRLRDLTIGPVAWGLWSLTFHDGSTWAALAFRGSRYKPENIVGWAAVSSEYDFNPMVGAYVLESERGTGIGSTLVKTLCTALVDSGDLTKGDTIVATTSRWGKYFELLADCGLVCKEWE